MEGVPIEEVKRALKTLKVNCGNSKEATIRKKLEGFSFLFSLLGVM